MRVPLCTTERKEETVTLAHKRDTSKRTALSHRGRSETKCTERLNGISIDSLAALVLGVAYRHLMGGGNPRKKLKKKQQMCSVHHTGSAGFSILHPHTHPCQLQARSSADTSFNPAFMDCHPCTCSLSHAHIVVLPVNGVHREKINNRNKWKGCEPAVTTNNVQQKSRLHQHIDVEASNRCLSESQTNRTMRGRDRK